METEGQLRIAFTDRQADFYMTGRLLTVRFRIVGETEGDSLSRLTLSAPQRTAAVTAAKPPAGARMIGFVMKALFPPLVFPAGT